MPRVIKANGTIEEFSEEKLKASIKRAGIPQSLEKQVLDHIKEKLYDNVPTSEIYQHIEEFLGKEDKAYYKEKYSLKKAIMELGPTGFPFEVYVSHILNAMGYKTQVGTFLMGKCVSHEVDIIAQNSDKKIFIECKFHNRPGTRSEVQTSLYTKARFDDLKAKHDFSESLLVTNTKITSDALSYAQCEGIKVMSWSYPEGGSLRELIEKYKLFPITQLSYLSLAQKQELLLKDIVLVRQICENPKILNLASIPQNKRDLILKEANSVCNL